MTVFIFNNGVPAANNNPSSDQPDMLINNQSNEAIWAVDHYGFNEAPDFGGLHKQVRLPELAVIPPGLVADEGTLYTKLADGTSQLFYSNEVSGNEYQMTRATDADFASFSTLNPYGAPPVGQTWRGGWTFLPGGLLLQYGFVVNTTFLPPLAPTFGTTNFPRAFSTTCFAVYTTTLYNTPAPSSAGDAAVRNNNAGSPSTTAFSWVFNTASAQYIGFNWWAIGR